jgi:hypothetical protein
MSKSKNVTIISFSPIARDARVLRQVQYLAPLYRLNVMGMGEEPAICADSKDITWHNVDPPQVQSPVAPIGADWEPGLPAKVRRFKTRVTNGEWIAIRNSFFFRLQAVLNLCKKTKMFAYWAQPLHGLALEKALAIKCDAILANDWNALPIAAKVARQQGARLVFDAHEYAPLEYDSLAWRLKAAPTINHVLKKYATKADAHITVGPCIAEKYDSTFGFNPVVIRNAPAYSEVPWHDTNPDAINIIHHGGAVRVRQLEDYIHIIKCCDSRFKLHFMLTGNDSMYIEELKALAQKAAPGRVEFHTPVAPEQVVEAIARFDIGLCFKKPLCFNEKYCMPNKFFDSIVAGLAVVSGPSPELSDIIGRYGLGKVAPSFSLKDVAKTVNSLSGQEIQAMRKAALVAAQEINADRELNKLVEIFAGLFNAK